MAYQILLDAALIIVAMGALHRFEARRVRPAHALRTRLARPVPNLWNTRRCGRRSASPGSGALVDLVTDPDPNAVSIPLHSTPEQVEGLALVEGDSALPADCQSLAR